jgi:signal transduction histidine kinase
VPSIIRDADPLGAKISARFGPLRNSLRARVALGVALPVFLALLLLSLTYYLRERRSIEEQIQFAAFQVGEVTLGSLQHVMLENDAQLMSTVIEDVAGMTNIERVQVLDAAGRIASDSSNQDVGVVRHVQEAGCQECHAQASDPRPRTILLLTANDTLRISTPIDNEPECGACHSNETGHLGVLLLDVSLRESNLLILKDLRIELAIAAISTLLITAGAYLLIHRLVVRRVEHFRQPLAALARGEFDRRPPNPANPKDELDELSLGFNHMTDELQRLQYERQTRSELRWQAIIEERERIAREIHDGVAQLMGYVNTKTAAVRLLIEKQELTQAEEQLKQLSDASSEAFLEVRSDILGLRNSTMKAGELYTTLKEFTDKFSELSGLTIDLHLPNGNCEYNFPPESELHLLRITQEALTNVYKHAKCDRSWVQLDCDSRQLKLTVSDDGIGFDPDSPPADRKPHFGLATMRERAEAMGAVFKVESQTGFGTQISVCLPLEEQPCAS